MIEKLKIRMIFWIIDGMAKKKGIHHYLAYKIVQRDCDEIKEKGIMDYILERLKEPSTWRGIIALISAAGVALKPEQADKIIALGIALAGLINVFRKEKPVNESEKK